MFRTFPLSITLHTAMVYGIEVCWQLASCQQTSMTYAIAACTVKNSWWWAEELSETCRFLFQKQIWKISAFSWIYCNIEHKVFLDETTKNSLDRHENFGTSATAIFRVWMLIYLEADQILFVFITYSSSSFCELPYITYSSHQIISYFDAVNSVRLNKVLNPKKLSAVVFISPYKRILRLYINSCVPLYLKFNIH